MVRAHFRKPSSTFSPVRALVSRNMSSAGDKTHQEGGGGLAEGRSTIKVHLHYIANIDFDFGACIACVSCCIMLWIDLMLSI
jgi:hypothetical protein